MSKRDKTLLFSTILAIVVTISAIKLSPAHTLGLITINRDNIVDYVIDDIDDDGVSEILILRQVSEADRATAQYDAVYSEGKTAAFPTEDSASFEAAVEKSNLRFANEFIICRFPDGNDASHKVSEEDIFLETASLNKIFSMDFSSIRPMMIKTGDITGNGQKEISICMFKTTEFHPIYAKRPFIYRYEDNRLVPLWLGSRLSKPFDDYIFADVTGNGVEELISIETTKEGRKVVSCYSWRDFGFEMLGESEVFDNLSALRKGEAPCIIEVTASDKGEPRNIQLIYEENVGQDRFYNAGRLIER